MSSKTPRKPTPGTASGDSTERQEAADLLLAQTMQMLEPLVNLLIAQGVGYPTVAKALRGAFIDAAYTQLLNEEPAPTDAAVSLRSGVHRKEVRAAGQLRQAGGSDKQPTTASGRSLSIAEQVYTRWTTDAGYRDTNGMPAPIPFSGDAPSFDALVAGVTRDFSKRTILDELIRIGLVQYDDGLVTPQASAMVPSGAWAETVQYMGDHLHDHMAAGTANLQAVLDGEKPPFLEHSMYANGLSDESIAQLAAMAREVWKPAFNQVVGAARQRYELDRDDDRQGRLRFGVYVFSEPDEQTNARVGRDGKKAVKQKRKKPAAKSPAGTHVKNKKPAAVKRKAAARKSASKKTEPRQ